MTTPSEDDDDLPQQAIPVPVASSFQEQLVRSLQDMFSASSAFCLLLGRHTRAYASGFRRDGADGQALYDGEPFLRTLSYGAPTDGRFIRPLSELASAADAEKEALDRYFGKPPAVDQAAPLVVFLQNEAVCGLVGLSGRGTERPFTETDLRRLEEFAPIVLAGAGAQLAAEELELEGIALRALGRGSGGYLLIDCEKKRVMWAASRERPIEWQEDIAKVEHFIVGGAEGWLAARASDDILPTPFKLPIGLMTAAAEIDETVLGVNRCLAARVQAAMHVPISDLSSRERTVARLLVPDRAHRPDVRAARIQEARCV
jgi:hypothetical protein